MLKQLIRAPFGQKDSFSRGVSIYLGANILNSAIPFFLLPILTRVLTPAEYGIIGMFQIMLGIFAAFISLSTPGAAARKYFDQDVGVDFAAFMGSCAQLNFFIMVLTLAVVYLLGTLLSSWTGLDQRWLFMAVIVSFATVLMQLRLIQWQVRKKSLRYGIFQVSQSLVNLLLSLWLVVALSGGWEGRLWGQSLPLILYAVIGLYLLRKSRLIKMNWRPDYFRHLFSFGLPLVPASIGLLLLGATDRFLINRFLGLDEVGIYMVAAQLAMAFSIVVDAVMKAYYPWLYGNLKRDNRAINKRIVTLTYLFFLVTLLAALLVALVAPFAVPWLAGEEYSRAGSLLSWMALGIAFVAMQLPLGGYIFYSERTASQSVITLTAGVLHVALVYWLVPAKGINGAAMAGIISAGLRFAMTWWAAQRLHPMPWLSPLRPEITKHA